MNGRKAKQLRRAAIQITHATGQIQQLSVKRHKNGATTDRWHSGYRRVLKDLKAGRLEVIA